MTLDVRVTAKDIREGIRRACDACPVALAARRAYLRKHPRAKLAKVFVRVSPITGIRIIFPNRPSADDARFDMPDRARIWIRAFDSFVPLAQMKPMRFTARRAMAEDDG